MRLCVDCGLENRFVGSTRCHRCYDRRRRTGRIGTCARCSKSRPIHDPDGRCDFCVFVGRPRPVVIVPPCVVCGEARRIIAHGRCNRCLSRSPTSTETYADGLALRLGPSLPDWYRLFVAHVVERYSPSEARLRLTELARLLGATSEPDALVRAATHPGGRLSPLGRTLDEFFERLGSRHAAGDSEALAAGRRARQIATVPEQLRPAVAAFSVDELANRERARRSGGRVLTDQTLMVHLHVICEFIRYSEDIIDWATVSQGDIERYMASRAPVPSHILSSLHAFFGWARRRRLILVDPTRGVQNKRRRRFAGPVVDLTTQRRVFRRWTTDPGVHPYEALVGLLSLVHAVSVNDLRHLKVTDIDRTNRTVRFAGRSRPVPLDPSSWTAIEGALAHRLGLGTINPHVIVSRRTKVTDQPMGDQHANNLLKPSGVTPTRLRCTRLAQLVTTIDPVLVAELFGVTHGGALYYLSDSVDDALLRRDL